MVAILVPSVAEATLAGSFGGHPFICRFHYKLSTTGINWTTAQLNSLCDGLMSGIAVSNGVGALTCGEVLFNGVTAVDLGTTTPALGSSSHAAIAGSAGVGPPPSVCVLVHNITVARYRGGHSRTYMPAMASSGLDAAGSSWVVGSVNAYQTAYSNMQDAALAAVPGIIQVAVRYNFTYTDTPAKKKYLATRVSLNSTPQVLSWTVKAPIGTQRRRARIGG